MEILNIIIAVVGLSTIVLLGEYLSLRRVIKGEVARKFVHILSGTFIAFWPWIISFRQIQIITIAIVVTLLISKRYSIFYTLHSVKRQTYGEIMFALGVGISALMFENKAIFCVAILHLALADGLAAIVGSKWGRKNSFKILESTKSVAGTMTFYLISLFLCLFFWEVNGELNNVVDIGVVMVVLFCSMIAAGLTILELVSQRGVDNIVIPVAAAVILNTIVL